MEYKLLIVRNRFKGSIKSLDKGLNWFAKNTPLTITKEEITTNFDVTTKVVSNATFKGVICGEDIYDKLRTVVPEGKYHAVVFIYGNTLDGIRVSSSEVMPLYPGTDLIQLSKLNDSGKSLNHEIFHTFFHRLQRQQVMVEDCMDSVIYQGKVVPYFNNDDLNAKPSNRSIALERLAPYWGLVANIMTTAKTLPRVEITRTNDNGVETLGILEAYNNGAKFTCKTLELPWKNNQSNISCIPKGTYEVKYTFSRRFLKFTYEIQSVQNRSGIRFHSANYFFDFKGCIGLGSNLTDMNNDGQIDIVNSKLTISAFENFMNKKPFTLTII